MTAVRPGLALALVAAAAIQGCTWYVYDATGRPLAARIVGQCFALRDDAILAQHYSGYQGYTLNTAGANACTPRDVTPGTRAEPRYQPRGLRMPECTWVPVAVIPAGTTFTVTRVTEKPRGGPWTGGVRRCWEVEVTLTAGARAGVEAGIPSCSFDVPGAEQWLRMESAEDYADPLEVSGRVASPCAE